ncbi:MAG: TetR family transcriptional regulator [Candidatus Acidiferrales bacterium]|jgi:AcrR family transcriptional regulator
MAGLLAHKMPIVQRRSEPRLGRRERHRAETRERLFRAALRLFAERGYQETTVEAITEAADVGKGTFFNYFPTKEHVLATFGDERIAAIERAVEEARKQAGPILPVLKNLTIGLAGQSSESAALLRAIYAAHASCLPVRSQLQKRLRRARSLMAEMLDLAQKRGEIRRNLPAADLARLIQLIFHGVTLSWALNPDLGLRETTEGVWELIVPALLAQSK